MRRRELITLLGGAAATWPLAVRAQQQPTMPVVGILASHTSAEWTPFIGAFDVGLKEIGFVEARTFASSTAGRKGTTIDFPCSPPTLFAAASPSSQRSAGSTRRSQPRL